MSSFFADLDFHRSADMSWLSSAEIQTSRRVTGCIDRSHFLKGSVTIEKDTPE